MSKGRGVSAEEKRTRMLDFFHEKKEFYRLKDLEKIVPKEKGIIVNSIKDVLQNLVDDGLVDTDKIGTSVYYWSFPSKSANICKRKLEETRNKFEETRKKLKVAVSDLNEAKIGREDNRDRDKLLDKVVDLQLERDELVKKHKEHEDNNPKVFEKMRDQIKDIKEATNRWTDNVFSIKSWCKNKFGFEDAVIDKQFGIPSDFDYI